MTVSIGRRAEILKIASRHLRGPAPLLVEDRQIHLAQVSHPLCLTKSFQSRGTDSSADPTLQKCPAVRQVNMSDLTGVPRTPDLVRDDRRGRFATRYSSRRIRLRAKPMASQVRSARN